MPNAQLRSDEVERPYSAAPSGPYAAFYTLAESFFWVKKFRLIRHPAQVSVPIHLKINEFLFAEALTAFG